MLPISKMRGNVIVNFLFIFKIMFIWSHIITARMFFVNLLFIANGIEPIVVNITFLRFPFVD